MMPTRRVFLILVVMVAAGGCQQNAQRGPKELVVHRSTAPLQPDGRLDKPAWQQVQAVAFDVPRELRRQGQSLEERGGARLLWDDRFLHVAFEFVDSDVIALGKEDDDGQHLLGDVAEVFLKPADQTWYWEFLVTPAGYAAQHWCAGRGRWGLKDDDRNVKPRFIELAVNVQGTLNNWRDRDQGWTVEVAIPFEKLDRYGELPNRMDNWTILLARYNYTRYRMQATGPELSSWPVVSRPLFHLVDEYAQLKLVP